MVNRISTAFSESAPLLAASFGSAQGPEFHHRAKAAGLDVAELRVDRFPEMDSPTLRAAVTDFAEIPTLLTIRSAAEGGEWKGTEAERLRTYLDLMPIVDGVDVEFSSTEILAPVIEAARQHDKFIMISFHDFAGTPEPATLDDLVASARTAGADCVKVSTFANTADDIRTLASFTMRHSAEPLITIAMGAQGSISRVFFPALGSRMTYAFLGGKPAPGQLDYDETFQLLRRFYPEFDSKKITESGGAPR